jgi:glucuronide carrier protein
LLRAIGTAGALRVAFAPDSVPVVAFTAFAVLLSIGGISTLMWALVAGTVECDEWQTDHRIEGAVYSVFSFTRKVGQAVAAAAYIIGLGGYVGGAGTQLDSAIDAIKFANELAPRGRLHRRGRDYAPVRAVGGTLPPDRAPRGSASRGSRSCALSG